MAAPFMGQIILFGGSYAPVNWAICDGRLLNVQDYQELFSLIGTTYGGNGVTTFGLPDLRGRMLLGSGAGVLNLTPRKPGQAGGVTEVTLTLEQMPLHTHTARAVPIATAPIPSPNAQTTWGGSPDAGIPLFSNGTADIPLSPSAIGRAIPTPPQATSAVDIRSGFNPDFTSTPNTEPHDNLPPYLVLNYLICTEGLFPVKE